jgi:hypothetical protein
MKEEKDEGRNLKEGIIILEKTVVKIDCGLISDCRRILPNLNLI